MNRKATSLTLSVLLATSYLIILDTTFELTAFTNGTTLYVNTTGSGGAYTHILWAIDNASDGNTVFVYSGIYYENIVVNKTINLMGEDRNTTIINGNGVGNVVRLTNADYVNVSNFGIRNGEIGIRIDFSTSHYNNISWNRVYDIFSIDDAYGIYGGTFTIFYKNTVNNVSTNGTDRDATGIAVVSSNTVLCNTVSDVFSSSRFAEGIRIADLNNVAFNDIFNISSNGSDGYTIWELDPRAVGIYVVSDENNITSNHIHNVFTTNVQDNIAYGIFLYEASYNNIISNHIHFINSSYDEVWGISLRNYCNFNNIISNYVYNLSTPDWVAYGIHVWNFSNNNTISYNHVMNLTNNRKNIGILSSISSNNNILENDVYNLFVTGTSSGQAFGIQVTEVLHYFNNVISNRVHDIHALYGQSMGIYYGSVACSNISSNLVYNISSIDEYAVGIRTIGPADYNNITFNLIWNITSTNHCAYGIQNQRLPIQFYNISSNKIINISGGQEAYGIFLEEDCNSHNLTSNYINNVSSPTSIAYGMSFRDASHNIVDNCTINDANGGVHMDGQSIDNIFINCSILNTETYDFHFDIASGGDSHATTLNTTFNKTRVYYADTLSNLTVMWFMHVKVIYLNESPVSNPKIWINDTHGIGIFEGQGNSIGWTKWHIVTEYIEQDTNYDHIGERIYFTPHSATATDGELWGYAYPYMGISKVVIIVLGLPTYLLQPTNLTTKVVNNGNNVELEWEPVSSPILDHYLIYKADSATNFDFTAPHNSSTNWPNPKNTTWIDPDPNVTALDDDFYYIVRAANIDESEVSATSNTAGVWTRTFQAGISTFSLPLEPFVKKDVKFYCQDMNASYIKWMNLTTHTWMRHEKGDSGNNSLIEIGKGYEIGFEAQTRYTFTGMPGAMILYDNISFGFDATPLIGNADSLTAKVDSDSGTVNLSWAQPMNIGPGDGYSVLRSTSRDGFWGTLGVNYTQLAVLPFDVLSYQDIGNATEGTEYYYMIVPVNLSTGERGSSSYSIGVWTASYLDQYDTFGLPLKQNSYLTADWYCDNINNTVGINYYNHSGHRWEWHSKKMSEGAFDPVIEMGFGYQISISAQTKFSFVGV